MGILEAIQLVGSILIEPIKGWQERKKARLESEIKINEAKTQATIKRLETGQAADIAWEQLSIANAGWKDEFFVIVFSIPLILCFIPGMVTYVTLGFAALATTPDWYHYGLMIMIASSFGVKKFIDFKRTQKGD